MILIPALGGLGALLIRADAPRRALLVATAVIHTGLTAIAWQVRPDPLPGGWIAFDAAGLYFVSITSLLYLAGSFYAVAFLRRQVGPGGTVAVETGMLFSHRREAGFTACLLFLLSTMTLAAAAQHFGLLWVAVEGGTLAGAPLIFFTRSRRSLEATWKYLVLCSVGVALALLGTFFLAAAVSHVRHETALTVRALVQDAARLDATWLKAAFLFFLVGYGSKMGLAPMHSWLPDAYAEAPSVVSALLSGALANCSFLGLLRAQQVCLAAGVGSFGGDLLVLFGLVSMAVAAVFLLGQSDYKRMLAYSSIEHMGILALGVGVGGAAVYGAMLHALASSLSKGMLFFLSGNIVAAYRTRASAEVQGMLRVLPITGTLWVAGLLAVTGSPPFGSFLSEFTILKGVLDQGRGWTAAAYLGSLAVIFVAMATPVLRMAQPASVPGAGEPRGDEPWLSVVPPALLGVILLWLGIWMPQGMDRALREISRALGGA